MFGFAFYSSFFLYKAFCKCCGVWLTGDHCAILDKDCFGLRMKRNRVQGSSTERSFGSDAVFIFPYISWRLPWAFLLFGFSHFWVEKCERRPEENRTLFFRSNHAACFFAGRCGRFKVYETCCRYNSWVDGSPKGRRTSDKAGVSRSGSQCDQSASIQPGDSGGLVLKMNWLGQDMSRLIFMTSRALAASDQDSWSNKTARLLFWILVRCAATHPFPSRLAMSKGSSHTSLQEVCNAWEMKGVMSDELLNLTWESGRWSKMIRNDG